MSAMPVQTGHDQVQGLFAVVAVLGVEGVQGVQQGYALGGVPGGHFRQQQGGGDGVLVPDIVAEHIADGFLVGENDRDPDRRLPAGPSSRPGT